MPAPRQIPRKAWLDGLNPFHWDLYRVSNARDRLRKRVAEAFHAGLPDEVAACLVDGLMALESKGEEKGYAISDQVDGAIQACLDEVSKEAIDIHCSDGVTRKMIPVYKLKQFTRD